jgi:hypothetical protein
LINKYYYTPVKIGTQTHQGIQQAMAKQPILNPTPLLPYPKQQGNNPQKKKKHQQTAQQ